DIAAAAAAALTETGHGGRAYELTGPALVTPREQAAAIGAALGEPVRFHELSRTEARAFMGQFMPEHVVDGTLDILGRPTPDEQRPSPAVEQLTGRPAGTFADWASRNAGAFA
ncbi:NmrA family transcriptional regulator, partial [Streptomyces sp. T-3]|nr:NmrA family transcriptional regulator [Streptomyces sp. T-3]